ncbi:MAG: N-acetylmuramic acid 6-phosphate etherase [Alphaproteobacteria bacterium]|nr:MAG: N-acetylmuramic acid 6-phosphate etherase [Alphaproteobacteria bacterium]
MGTEDINARYIDLDLWGTEDGVRALHEGQVQAVAAVAPAISAIAAAVDDAAPRLKRGGRLIYVGAGTSARIGVQDGAELFPTFSWPKDQVAFAIAGGEGALLQAVENAEDSVENGVARMVELDVGVNDVVIGIAASGNTPYTVAAIKEARVRGALTIGVANNASQLMSASQHPILVDTGPEAVAGSTRMKAGTAQKIVLNLLSTMIMVRLGKVYRGLMVHMRPTNAKLRNRAAQMVVMITGCDEQAASDALAKADGDVKLAVLLASGADMAAATSALSKHDGNLRFALAEITPRQ